MEILKKSFKKDLIGTLFRHISISIFPQPIPNLMGLLQSQGSWGRGVGAALTTPNMRHKQKLPRKRIIKNIKNKVPKGQGLGFLKRKK